jgi:hypothetical protein
LLCEISYRHTQEFWEPKPRQIVTDCGYNTWEVHMGRGILLWLLGVPIPVIILLALLWH